jgi:hypothetical protein
MIESGLDILIASTMRTDNQTDRVLLFGQVTEKNDKAHPSHFLKFLLVIRSNGTFVFARHTRRTFAKPNEFFLLTQQNYLFHKKQYGF